MPADVQANWFRKSGAEFAAHVAIGALCFIVVAAGAVAIAACAKGLTFVPFIDPDVLVVFRRVDKWLFYLDIGVFGVYLLLSSAYFVCQLAAGFYLLMRELIRTLRGV